MADAQVLVDSMDPDALVSFLSGLDEVSSAANGIGHLATCVVDYIDDEAKVIVTAVWDRDKHKWIVSFQKQN